ncbi:protein translocase subunit SecF [Pseudactinotalea suaedae]|uniref:protein translocase subunit SecF n=1 Tax=Pseudactinotalea suaedae TaxID=1524924 RepID=UPI0012E1D49D|nr:protein translocase subunit SecF [Pseudactinotalea suaedae]
MASFAQLGNELYTGKRSFDIIGHRRRWFAISFALLALSVVLLFARGINPGIEFRGGSEFTVSGTSITDQQPAHDALASIAPSQAARVSTVGNSAIRVQTEQLTDEETSELRELLAAAYEVDVADVTASFVGPTWGQSVTNKALQGLVIFLVLVSIVMAVYFRRWTMAAAALIALLHDLVITVGLYAGVGFEVTPATVIGFLTILGYSLYDTVVVFDKVRENTEGLHEQTRYTYAEASNLAVNQTLVRSINTSVLAVLPVGSILFVGAFLLGAGTLRDIALALFIGMIVSTLSSVFIAAPMEVVLRTRDPAIRAHTEKVLEARRRRLAEAETQGEDATELVGAARVGGLRAGGHLGQAALPRRRRGKK